VTCDAESGGPDRKEDRTDRDDRAFHPNLLTCWAQ
jgi:hypothetical protein